MIDSGDSGRLSALESRMASLETQAGYLNPRMDRSEGKLEALMERVTRVEKRISHLPTKEQVVKIALGLLAAITAVITFQNSIRSLFGF